MYNLHLRVVSLQGVKELGYYIFHPLTEGCCGGWGGCINSSTSPTCHIDDKISSGSHIKLPGKEIQVLEIGQMCAEVVRVREHGEGPKGVYYRNTSYKKAPQRQGWCLFCLPLFLHYLAQKRCSIKSVEERKRGRKGRQKRNRSWLWHCTFQETSEEAKRKSINVLKDFIQYAEESFGKF